MTLDRFDPKSSCASSFLAGFVYIDLSVPDAVCVPNRMEDVARDDDKTRTRRCVKG